MSFLEFLEKYWQVIAALLSVVASIVIWCLKKKPVLNQMDTILLAVFENLTQIINQVELLKCKPVETELGTAGVVTISSEDKKSLALYAVKEFVKKQFSVNLPDSYISLIGKWIEDILSTPQKKEVSI